MKKEKLKKLKKVKKDYTKVLLIALYVLLGIDIVMIPLYILAEVKPFVGIFMFILIPLTFACLVALLSKNCVDSYNRKKKIVEEKLKGTR